MRIIAAPIEMIAWFTEEGMLKPIRFRMKNGDTTENVVKIDKILFMDKEKIAGNTMFVYRCQSLIAGEVKLYEIKYEVSSCKWILFKM